MAKQTKRKYQCKLPIDLVENIKSLYGDHGTHFDNVVSFFRKILYSYDYDHTVGKVISYNYRWKLLRSSRSKFTELINQGLLVQTKKPSKSWGRAASYKIGTNRFHERMYVEYKEVYRRSSENLDILSTKVGQALNKLSFVDIPEEDMRKFVEGKVNKRINKDETATYYYEHNDSATQIPLEKLNQFKTDKVNEIIDRDINLIKKLKAKDHLSFHYPYRNKTNRRMEHSLNGLSDYYHKYMRYNSEEMVLLDLGCSQPTILNSLMEPTTYKTPIYRLNDGIYDYKGINKDIYIGGCSSQTYNGKYPVKSGLSALVSSNTLYEHICEVNGWEWSSSNKTKAKQFFFSCLYGPLPKSNDAEYKTDKRIFMERDFPDVVNYIDSFKLGMVPYFERMKENHPITFKRVATKFENGINRTRTPREMAAISFPVFMQRIESYLFIDKSLRELINRGVPCIPKHDGLLVPKSKEGKAISIIKKHLDKHLGENCYKLVPK